MARRRYISTKLSLDAKVNKLAMTAGDFAALLYTWMIPHAEDDARLTGDPDEILMMVCPGRRDKSTEDIAAALQAMHDLGLVEWNREENYVQFPASFYGYQTYITEKRKTAQSQEPPRETPTISAKQRKTAQNSASSSVSLKSSVSLMTDAQAPSAEPPEPMASSASVSPSVATEVQQAINIFGNGVVSVVGEYAPKLDAMGKSILAEAHRWRQDFPRGNLRNFQHWLDVALKPDTAPARASPLTAMPTAPPKKFHVFGEKSA